MEQSLERCHVLVVDDESDFRFLASQVLTRAGAHVTAVNSTGDALHAMQMQRFDAMVADIGMPNQDGYALIRAVRNLTPAEGGQVPAIAVTAYASARDREQALAAGFDAHVPKPVDPKELVASVVDVIRTRGVALRK